MRAHRHRPGLALALALVATVPIAVAESEPIMVEERVVSGDPFAPIELTQTQCGGTAPLPGKTQCVTVFKTGATLTTEVLGCYTGDITITFRDVKVNVYPKVTRQYLLGVVCGSIVDWQAAGSLYANREVSATAVTSSFYGLVQVGAQDPGLGPWTVRYTF